MSTVTDRRKAPAVDNQPIDTELIAESTDAALRMKLGTSTRESIDIRTTAVIEQLNRLLGMDLDADADPDIRNLVSRANKLLELSARPTKETPAFSAFFYMRDVASLTRRLLWVCLEAGGHAP